ncbi:MAG: PqqD family protein [Microthrixaceae bacterium]|nr:PqqD family protein [Microthrixaceae bacterium]MCO5318009.1 PqqD family protein [Microthrixaceae bacterium]
MGNSGMSYTHAAGLTWDRVEDRVVVLDTSGSEMITLNPVASMLWPRLVPRASADDLVQVLSEEFSTVPEQQIRDDVAAFIEELLGEGLLEVSRDE